MTELEQVLQDIDNEMIEIEARIVALEDAAWLQRYLNFEISLEEYIRRVLPENRKDIE